MKGEGTQAKDSQGGGFALAGMEGALAARRAKGETPDQEWGGRGGTKKEKTGATQLKESAITLRQEEKIPQREICHRAPAGKRILSLKKKQKGKKPRYAGSQKGAGGRLSEFPRRDEEEVI